MKILGSISKTMQRCLRLWNTTLPMVMQHACGRAALRHVTLDGFLVFGYAPPGELMYIEIGFSGFSDSKNSS